MAHKLTPGAIAVVFGTRPEMIKLSPLVRLLGPAARLIHTGQHFDHDLSEDIASDVDLPDPETNVATGGKTRAGQIGEGITRLEPVLDGSSGVIVQGDTNSTLAAAITANALGLPLFHVEAGLRSFDRRMPEEHNRVLVDHLADMCWAPTYGNEENLLAERIDANRIEVTGNTIVEALLATLPVAEERLQRRLRLGVNQHPYVLVTLHRPENVDDLQRLEAILKMLGTIPCEVVLPLHPRTAKRVTESGLASLLSRLFVIPSVTYRNLLSLLADCSLAISDSGGIQEEVSVLKVPLIVLRHSTERPEVLGTFAKRLSEPDDVLVEAQRILDTEGETKRRLQTIDCPFGDGKAADRMYESLLRYYGK